MSGLGGLNKAPDGVVIGLVQLPTIASKSDLAAQTQKICAMVAKARLDGLIAGQRSSTATDRPARARSPAAVSPVGPAPTTRTSTL